MEERAEVMAGMAKPLRAEGLEIDEAGDGFIIYDGARDRVHYLNHTAALVLELATGQLDIRGIASWIGQVYGLDESPVADVERSVDELVGEGLLQSEPRAEPGASSNPTEGR